MHSFKNTQKRSFITFFSCAFVALLMITANHSYACSDQEYLGMIYTETEKVSGDNKVMGYEMHRMSNFAQNIYNISNHCANNTKSYESKQKMLKIKMYADSLKRNSDNYVKTINQGMNGMNTIGNGNGGSDVFVGLFSVIGARSTADALMDSMESDMKNISNTLKEFMD